MKTTSTGQLLFGLLIVGLGIGFLIDALNLVDFSNILKIWWPLIIVVVGIASFISNPRLFLWPLIVVALGVLLQLQSLELITFNVWQLVWPSIVIIFGISLLLNKGRAKRPNENKEETVDLFCAFSGNQARSTTQNFKGGNATAIFGGIELDLTDANIKDKASLDVLAAFGGVEIRVPEGWVVHVSGLPIFGGWEDKTRRPKDNDKSPVLSINGTCMFGGVTIKN